MSHVDQFFLHLQKICLPGIWSKGMTLAREETLLLDSEKAGEFLIRIVIKNKPVHPRVTLWTEDNDSYCDCGDRNDPCIHIAAAVIALKQGLLKKPEQTASTQISYRLSRSPDGKLALERWLVRGDPSTAQRLDESLVSYVGGIQSGRISAPTVACTQEDYALDSALIGTPPHGLLESKNWPRVLQALKFLSTIQYGTLAVEATPSEKTGLRAWVTEEKSGYRLRGRKDPRITETFKNGVALCGSKLMQIEEIRLTDQERGVLLTSQGKLFSLSEAAGLFSEWIPTLQKKMPVDIEVSHQPTTLTIKPILMIEAQWHDDGRLSALPRLVYGQPPVAEITAQGLVLLDNQKSIPIRDPAEERFLQQMLLMEMKMTLGQATLVEPWDAPKFMDEHKNIVWFWKDPQDQFKHKIITDTKISPAVEWNPKTNTHDIFFALADQTRVTSEVILNAWRENKSWIQLVDGGWAKVQSSAIDPYVDILQSILDAKNETFKKLEITRLYQVSQQAPPPELAQLRSQLEAFDSLPAVKLPDDLQASLRPYQQTGVNWLCYLRTLGLGALLADDMGLGKTLQALCALQGKTLIVCPTSVLHAWTEQIQKFRPSLTVCRYHGPSRVWNPDADITLTSYGILRNELQIFQSLKWDTALLDEAQMIKNPESLAAQSAKAIPAHFKITLSGTPVENSLDDLWSQMDFLNPGFLGTREEFNEQWARSPESVRSKVKPLVLRRLKKNVAADLPPRTETILYCTLSESEQKIYDSLLASSRKEITSALNDGKKNVFSILELLLRLRQACCHPSLVPGQNAPSSSKVDLLMESLESALAQGHKALVFSQWTSYLDLIEKKFQEQGFSYLRLDGSTVNRSSIVDQFQSSDGPPLLLMSLKAGGVGLTLTAADHVYLMDPWWNPAAEDQAADRAHRIGQTQPVFIHKLAAENTIEEKILELQIRKQQLAQSVLESSAASSFTRDDLLALLE